MAKYSIDNGTRHGGQANNYQDDPIQNRSLSHQCWNGHHPHKNEFGDITGCSGWKERCERCVKNSCRGGCACECHLACECLCHQDSGKTRIVKDRHASESIIEKHGTEALPGKQCKFSKKEIQCKAMAGADADYCLLHGFMYKPNAG